MGLCSAKDNYDNDLCGQYYRIKVKRPAFKTVNISDQLLIEQNFISVEQCYAKIKLYGLVDNIYIILLCNTNSKTETIVCVYYFDRTNNLQTVNTINSINL